MYCAFVDFEKAFDNIWRVALWYKLLLNKINGKMYNFIVNMYNSIKSCIVYNEIHREDRKRINLTAIIKIYSIN